MIAKADLFRRALRGPALLAPIPTRLAVGFWIKWDSEPEELMILSEGLLGLMYGSEVFFGRNCLFRLPVAGRFRTDSNLPGVERIAVCKPDSAFLEQPYASLQPLPQSSFVLSLMVKVFRS